MRIATAANLLLLAGSTAIAAIVEQRGNTCTVSPGGGAKTRKRAASLAEPQPPAVRTPSADDPKIVLDHFPRPVPGSAAARHYDRKAAAELPAEVSMPEDQPAYNTRDVDEYEAGAADDDTPEILDAFKKCGHDGSIVFTEGTFNLRQVMNTTDLRNCDISIYGKFVWSADNIQYWLSHSFSVTYAGRSTAWLFGGVNVSMRGYGKALFDGNGQTWIDQNRGAGNQNGRPISLAIWHGTNIYIDGITWRMAQFWHTFIAHSQNVTMTNLDMKTLSANSNSAVNTDGTDTWNSRDIVISNWTVSCGDVSLSVSSSSSSPSTAYPSAAPPSRPRLTSSRTASPSRATAPTCTCPT